MTLRYTDTPRYRRCQALFDRAYPNFENAEQRYRAMVEAVTQADTRLLDVGCGRMSLAQPAIDAARWRVGIDLSWEDLRRNESMQAVTQASATALPFPDAAFDVVISQWVVEHFDAPGGAFREIARVLRPGGHVALLTTNAHNYIPLASRIVPARVRHGLIRQLLRRPAHESFPTYFRANTGRALRRLAEEAGLTVEALAYVGNPFYLAFNMPLFRLALLYEHITDRRRLRHFKLYLLARLRKDA
jgi:ubiquinone/menaquinone biosynthesis C-methylase UbiE